MTLKGAFNAPQPTPGRSWDERVKPCCARCQRGTKAVLGPCGMTNCKCHGGESK